MDEKKAVQGWLEREKELQNIIRRIVRETASTAQETDEIDVLLDVLAATLTEEVREYLENEYGEAYKEGLDGLIPDPDWDASDAVWAVVDGKDFEQRILEYAYAYADDLDSESLETKLHTLALSDGHRVRGDARQTAGEELAAVGYTVTKSWRSVKIPTTRETHWLLHGTTVPIDEYFYTVNGRAKYPGGFGVAEEDVNCLCSLVINVEELDI